MVESLGWVGGWVGGEVRDGRIGGWRGEGKGGV